VTEGDVVAAIRISSEHTVKVTSHFRPESYCNTNGGHIHYAPDTVSLISLTGTVQKRNNSAIPAPFGVAEKYPNVQAFSAVASQLVTVNAGRWVTNVPLNTWNKLLPKDGGMDAAALSAFATAVCLVLNNSKIWKAMDTTTKNSVSGIEQLTFIRTEMDGLAEDDYYLLNTRVVYTILRPYELDQGVWYERINEHGEPIVPAKHYQQMKVSKLCLKQCQKEGYPRPYLYLGGYAPHLNLPAKNGLMKETLERYQKMLESQVGSASTTAILSGMRGYSGLTDEFGKRIQFYLSAILAGWAQGRKVDVQLYTVGDLPILYSSLQHWVQYIKKTLPDFSTEEVMESVKFILPGAQDMKNVYHRLKGHCCFAPRPGTLIVVYSSATLPTSQEKNVTVDYEANSEDLIPAIWRQNDFIVYAPVYCDYFWTEEEKSDSKVRADKPKKKISIPSYIYGFGTAANWRGIISSVSNLTLVGFGYKRDELLQRWCVGEAETLVRVPLKKYSTFKDWLGQVSDDCATQIVAFLRPISRYSPISNLVYMSKKGTEIVLSAISGDEGQLIGNIARIERERVRRGRKITSDENDEIPADVQTEEKEDDKESPPEILDKKKKVQKIEKKPLGKSTNSSNGVPANPKRQGAKLSMFQESSSEESGEESEEEDSKPDEMISPPPEEDGPQ
jgi:hypothetical protein